MYNIYIHMMRLTQFMMRAKEVIKFIISRGMGLVLVSGYERTQFSRRHRRTHFCPEALHHL